MRVLPFSYLEQVEAPPAGGMPKEANLLMRFEDVNTNNSGGGTIWTDTSGKGYVTGTLVSSAVIDAGTNSVLLSNTSTKNRRFTVTTNTNINVKTIAILFNQPQSTGGTGTNRAYFWDFRKANTESPNNGGFFNQYDSAGAGGGIYNGGEYWSYDELTSNQVGPLATTTSNLTNGLSQSLGGINTWQWLGPNGRAINTSKRLWVMNFSPTKDLNLTTTAVQGLLFGTNDNGSEGSSFGYYSIVGWDTYLDATDVAQLLAYYQAEGVIT